MHTWLIYVHICCIHAPYRFFPYGNYHHADTITPFEVNTKNTLNCDQSNYSARIVLSHKRPTYLLNFDPTGNSAIQSADTENPTLAPNMMWVGWPLAEIWPFQFFQMWGPSLVGRLSVVGLWSPVGRSSVYILLTLISYTPLRYVT